MNHDDFGVIRRGWQEAATTLAPHVAGMGDYLERRLDEAIRVGSLDETDLLEIADAAAQVAVDSGGADVAHGLGRRLRRTVYEYLLSLDATSPEENAPPPAMAPANSGASLVEAAEGAELDDAVPLEAVSPSPSPTNGAAGTHDFPLTEASDAPGGDCGEAATSEARTSTDDPGVTTAPVRLRIVGADDEPSETAARGFPAGHAADLTGSPLVAPHFSFHIGDPNDLVGQVPSGEGDAEKGAENEGIPAFEDDLDELDAPSQPGNAERAPLRASFADPSTWPKPATPMLRSGRGHGSQDLEPASPSPPPGPSAPDPRESSAGLPETHNAGAAFDLEAPAAAFTQPAADDAIEQRYLDAAEPTPGETAAAEPLAVPNETPRSELEVEDVPESDLSQLRASVEDRLRKKRCDEAAAMLQQFAQELGGRSVAEMALDAGDRCRSLGKANAALNCYLAASRADPVFEVPLARLADICIDDQDVDLAVSYLERIARLTRLRGDNNGALRIYRKIAAIAPYRDDVLEMLMRAQTTGRFDA